MCDLVNKVTEAGLQLFQGSLGLLSSLHLDNLCCCRLHDRVKVNGIGGDTAQQDYGVVECLCSAVE